MKNSVYRTSAEPSEVSLARLVRPARATRTASRVLTFTLVAILAALIFVPWQQNSQGAGRVIAYAPVERQQTIEASVEGRVVRWFVQEGDHVDEGAPVVNISDNDPSILDRLRQERDAQLARIEAARQRLLAIESRMTSLESAQIAALAGANARVTMARERATAAVRAREAAEQGVETARLNLDRQRSLFGDGLASKRATELAELDMVKTRTDLDRAAASERAARSEESAIASDLSRLRNDTRAAIDDATGTRAAAQSEAAGATAELARIEVRLARQATQAVSAPRAGIIMRVVARQGGEMVKAGDPLAILVPDTQDRAVELYVEGNDVPLVTPGRAVRLQFEGWPAVQFSGWPEVAVGTFGGVVNFIDASDDGNGRFRLVVVPDGKEPWPATRFLRQGTRVTGWVLLDSVRLGYEVWRRFNGFPPNLPTKEMFKETGPPQKHEVNK